MKLITLIENHVHDEFLTAEHGLSIYIETKKRNILFDTGQTGNFIKNSIILGIDISKVDDLVISHGHYDHTGGLHEFIKINKKAAIHIKEESFFEKYRSNKNDFIGIPFDRKIFGNRLNITEETIQITEDVFIIPKINIYNDNDLHYDKMLIKRNTGFFPDDFADEQFLVLKNKGKISIISGCSHNGITNIVETAKNIFNQPIDTVIGGFHLMKESDESIKFITAYFENLNPRLIAVSHCTGVEKYSYLKRIFGNKVVYNYTGNILEI
jgi:7,8-dihydropterin-6-yl-methyl-4-(beta-D-ribofuranosyl)aminobenzene 5'-phosphate synthase